MKFSIHINIMPQEALLDPQGKTVENNTSKLGIDNISNIRIGNHVSLEINSENKEQADETVKKICNQLLVNQITEQYSYKIIEC